MYCSAHLQWKFAQSCWREHSSAERLQQFAHACTCSYSIQYNKSLQFQSLLYSPSYVQLQTSKHNNCQFHVIEFFQLKLSPNSNSESRNTLKNTLSRIFPQAFGTAKILSKKFTKHASKWPLLAQDCILARMTFSFTVNSHIRTEPQFLVKSKSGNGIILH